MPDDRPLPAQAGHGTPFWTLVERAKTRMQTEARNRLIRGAAHDLRSPLNGIQGWAHVLESRVGRDSALVGKALDGIRNGVQQQVQMIGDLTDLLMLMNRDMALEITAVDLNAVVQRALPEARMSAASRQVRLEMLDATGDTTVQGDSARLTQALAYLLIHCARSALEEETLFVRVAGDADHVVVHIGDGDVAAAAMGEAQPSGKTPATLMLARGLIELHGGSVTSHMRDEEGIRSAYRIEFARDAGTTQARSAIASLRAQMPVALPRVGVAGSHEPVWLLDGLRALGLSVTMVDMDANSDEAEVDIVLAPSTAMPTVAGVVHLAYAESADVGEEPPPGALAVIPYDCGPELLASMVIGALETQGQAS